MKMNEMMSNIGRFAAKAKCCYGLQGDPEGQ